MKEEGKEISLQEKQLKSLLEGRIKQLAAKSIVVSYIDNFRCDVLSYDFWQNLVLAQFKFLHCIVITSYSKLASLFVVLWFRNNSIYSAARDRWSQGSTFSLN